MKGLLRGFNAFTAGLLGCVVFLAALQPVTTLGDPDWPQPLVMVCLTAAFLIILNWVRKWLATWTPATYRKALWVIGILIVLVQLAVAVSFTDAARADAYFVRKQAIQLAQGNLNWNNYFMIYPNNVNITLIEALLLRPLLAITSSPWIIMNVLRFAWLDTGLLAGLALLKHWRKWQPGAIAYLTLWLISVPVYAYGLYAYTDVLVFPLVLDILVLVLWTQRLRGLKRWLGVWATLLLLSLGVAVKSNMIVLWIAVGLLILLLWWQRQLTGRQVAGWVASACVLLAAVMAGMSLWGHQQGYRQQPDTKLPATSWIAMSLNPGTNGEYNLKDFTTVQQQPTAADKQAVASYMIQERLGRMGVSGFLIHVSRKFRLFWATGDFDSFKLTSQWFHAPRWYLTHQINLQFWLVTLTQVVYLAMLLQTIWVLFFLKRPTAVTSFLVLMMLGLTAFHVVIWEVEPRYALPLLPIIMLLGSVGLQEMPIWDLSPRVVRSGRWFAVILAAFCALSLGQTSQDNTTSDSVVGRQWAGTYIRYRTQALAPGQQMSWTAPAHGKSNRIQLYPRVSEGRVEVTVRDQTGVLARKRGKPATLATTTYPLTTAKQLRFTVKNVGNLPLRYGVAVADYNLHTGEVTPDSRVYPQYYLIHHHAPQALTRTWEIGLVVLVVLVGVLLTL